MAKKNRVRVKKIAEVFWVDRLKKIGVLAVIAIIYVWSARGVGFSILEIVRELPSFFSLLGEMIPPNWAYSRRLIDPLVETIQIAILGTFFGAILTIPLTLLAANNITRNRYIYFFAKGFMNIFRTIPELLYAAILVAGIGLGAFSGMLAITIFSTVVIAKLTSESLEAISYGPLEALQAVGGNKLQMIRYGGFHALYNKFLQRPPHSFNSFFAGRCTNN